LLEDSDGAGRKLGGILIETTSQADGARIAVIGIGLNVLPLVVPDARSGVACLHELDPTLDAPAVLHRIAGPLLRALAGFERDGFAAFEARYRARDLLLGRFIEAGGRSGVAAGVADDGTLLLRAHEQVHRIVSGDVSVRLQTHGSPASTPC
jgi:BirA family biotin operon repressor/biotin-[acetyl-CoA-carboxylase] ligase